MSHSYLLDTNTLSDLVRRPQGGVTQAIERVGETAVCTSIVVASELRFGALKSGSTRLQAQLSAILSAVDVLPLEVPVDRHYSELRHYLESRGTPIGPNDMLIAAQALASELIVVTGNEDEFRRVPGLSVENWLDA